MTVPALFIGGDLRYGYGLQRYGSACAGLEAVGCGQLDPAGARPRGECGDAEFLAVANLNAPSSPQRKGDRSSFYGHLAAACSSGEDLHVR